MLEIESKYKQLCETPSDINEHLPTLMKYASECEHITEMGVRYIVSTYALLMGKPKTLISYDILDCHWQPIAEAVKGTTDFQFKLGNTLHIQIEPTDFLFIDTLHNYDQLREELRLHADKAKKYIGFHDTSSFEWYGESYDGIPRKGIWPAIQEFLEANPHWRIKERFRNNNGLTILQRVNH